MELDELKKLWEFLFPFIPPFVNEIGFKDQEKYDIAFEELNKKIHIRNKFFIQKEIFIKMVFFAFENDAKVLKIHLIKESQDLDVNIGFSFSNSLVNENGTIDNDLDLFYILHNDQLLKTNKNDFNNYKQTFITTILTDIDIHTKKQNTQFIKYEMDDVIRYIIKNLLSNTFSIKGIIVNQFIFKDYDNINPEMNDRVGISIHNILEDNSSQRDLKSIGYDFGTIYP